MKRFLCLILLSLFPLPGHAQDDFPKAKFVSNVAATVSRIKSTRIQGGDFDDRTEKLTFKVVIKNSSNLNFPGVAMEFYLLGQNMVNTRAFKLMQAEKQTIALEAFKTLEIETPEIVSMWDNTGAVFGEKYKGWIFRLRAPDGSLLLEKSTSSFFTNTSILDTLQVGSYYDKALAPIANFSGY